MKSISLSSLGICHLSTCQSSWFRQGKSWFHVRFSFHSRTVPCTQPHLNSVSLHFRAWLHLWSLRCSSFHHHRYWKREVEVLVEGLLRIESNNYVEIFRNWRNTLIRFLINKIILMKCTKWGIFKLILILNLISN